MLSGRRLRERVKSSTTIGDNRGILLLKLMDSAVIKTLGWRGAPAWLPAEQTNKSAMLKCPPLASSVKLLDVAWSVKQTPVTRCCGDGNESSDGSPDKAPASKEISPSVLLPSSICMGAKCTGEVGIAWKGNWNAWAGGRCAAGWSVFCCGWLSLQLFWRLMDSVSARLQTWSYCSMLAGS